MQLDLPTRKQPRPLQSQAGSEPRTAQHQSAPGTMKPAGKPGGMQARIARQVGSLGPEASRAKTGAEALVLLEEDEAGWDAADLHSVQQKAKAVPRTPLPLALTYSQQLQISVVVQAISIPFICKNACCLLLELAASQPVCPLDDRHGHVACCDTAMRTTEPPVSLLWHSFEGSAHGAFWG